MLRPRGSWGLLVLPLAACGLLAGCQSSAKHYTLRGRVVSKSASQRQISVSHGKIPGFMPAMTMPYPVKDLQAFNDVQPGDNITAEVDVQSPGNYWLSHVVIVDKRGRGSVVSTAPRELTGEKVPDVPLTNQDGRSLLLSQFAGKAVLVTFIYTRCPLPNFCPRLSSEFAAIEKDLMTTPADYKKTHLVSISLDPAYDTPPVLRKYGLSYLGQKESGFKHWDFVDTTPANLSKLAAAFGLAYVKEDNQIGHNMNTILLAPDGTVAKQWPGSDWKPSDVVAAMRQVIAAKNPPGKG